MTLNTVAARARLVAEPKTDTLACASDDPRPRRVGDPTIFPDLTAVAALGHRHHDPLLVNIKSDIGDTMLTTGLLCMTLGAGQSGATLATCIL